MYVAIPDIGTDGADGASSLILLGIEEAGETAKPAAPSWHLERVMTATEPLGTKQLNIYRCIHFFGLEQKFGAKIEQVQLFNGGQSCRYPAIAQSSVIETRSPTEPLL